MPRIPTYQRQGTVSGQGPNVGGSFGEQAVPNALAGAAVVIGDLGNTLLKRQQEIKKEEQYYSTQRIGTLVNEEALNFEKDSLSRKGTDAFNSMEWADEWKKSAVGKYTKDLTDERQKFDVSQHIESQTLKIKNSLSSHEAKQRDAVAEDTRIGALASASKSAYQGFGTLDDNLNIYNTSIINDPRLRPTDKENKLVAGQSAIADSYLDGVVNRNPLAAMELIKSGTFNKYLTKERLQEFDTKIKPKLQASQVDSVISELTPLMPKDLDAPFEIDKLMAEVNKKTADTDLRKLVRTELKSLAADRAAAGKERFDYNYGKIADAWEVNPKLTTTTIMKMPEFTNLTIAQQGNVLAKIRQKIEHRDTTERATRASERSAVAAERSADAAAAAATQQRYDASYYYYRSRPELFAAMPENEFKALRLEMGDKQFAHLQDDRKKASTPEALRDATTHAATINNVLDKIPGLDDSEKAKYFTKNKSAIAAAQKRKGSPLSPAEAQTAIVENMQLDFVKEPGLFGGKKLKRKIEIGKEDKPVDIPADYAAKIDALEKKRGKTFSRERRVALYNELLKEGK